MNDKFDELIEFLEDTFDFEPVENCDIQTVEEEIDNINNGLNDKELMDSWDSMEETIEDLNKFKGKEYKCIFCTDWSNFFISHVYVIIDKDFNYIDSVML